MSGDEQTHSSRKNIVPGTMQAVPKDEPPSVLWWKVTEGHVPIASEEIMVPVLIRWGAKERGMMKDQPPFRLPQIRKKLKQAPGLRLDQALSLRRHHMKLLNPQRGMPSLRLGQDADIRESAEIFERAVEAFLNEQRIEYWNEKEQKKRYPDERPLTPDFLLPTPIQLKTFRQAKDGKRRILEDRRIHWLEAKMFYGASTISAGTNGAVGTILPKVTRYVEAFGPGAIIFMHGCGDQFAKELSAVGVTALSASAVPKRFMKNVWDHQQTWCSKDGLILP